MRVEIVHWPSPVLLKGTKPLEKQHLDADFRDTVANMARLMVDLRGVGLEISGDDLLAAGVPEGPAVGRALEETLRRKLDGVVSGRDAELETALQLAREHAQ